MLLACSVGCAGRFDPASFEGTREPRRAEPEAVLEVAASTAEMETLGKVHASCRLRTGFRRLDGERLSDLDCSTERLMWALHESAASAGGELLVGARCSARRVDKGSHESEVRCTSEVARYVAGPLANSRPLSVPRSRAQGQPAPTASDVRRIDEPDASLSFRITLSFEPVVRAYDRPALRGEQVHELPRLPLADQSLGDLIASCAGGCDEQALRASVLTAAGRLGAPDVVGVRCYRSAAGNDCVGTLAAPERRE
jgi:hypothetical protein